MRQGYYNIYMPLAINRFRCRVEVKEFVVYIPVGGSLIIESSTSQYNRHHGGGQLINS